MEFKERLAKLRRLSGMTQAELAKKMHISPVSVNKWMKNGGPAIDKLPQLCEILEISPNELFTNYISSLLPELGEQTVDTISFKKLLLREFPNFKNVESKSDMMEDILQNNKQRLSLVKYN